MDFLKANSLPEQLVNKVLDEREKNDKVAGLFIGLQKAFDCIDRQIFYFKLKLLGKKGTVFD